MIIKEVRAKKIKDSRNEDSIEIFVKSDIGKAKASAPTGKSKGKFEKEYYKGNLNQVIKKINSFEKLNGVEINNFNDLKKVERIFNFGSNPNVALEYAILKNFKKPFKKFNFGYRNFPIPLGNSIGGGLHTKNRRKPDFQEFLVYVENCRKFNDRVKVNLLVYNEIKKYLTLNDKSFKGKRNDEGAWISGFSNIEILDLLKKVCDKVSSRTNYSVRIGIDVAASSFYKKGKYVYNNYSSKKRKCVLTRAEQIEFLGHIISKYNIGYLEDPLDETDFEGFKKLKKRTNGCLVVGDDLTVTRLKRVGKAKGGIDAVIVKPNQVGSLIEVKKVVEFCKLNTIKTIFSHRSGETKEDFLADLCYMFGGDFLKAGIYGKERIVKYNRLKKIR